MTEIEKMYANARINKIGIKRCSGIKQSVCQYNCNKCESFDYKYPPFTTEKQIELIKWLGKRPLTLLIGQYKGKYYFGNSNFNSKADNFDNAIAIRINDLWQSLTDQEKEEVRKILNE